MSSAGWFQLVSWVAAVATFGWLIADSVRARQVTPMLAMGIALAAIFWLEAPWDWATWCQFNPELPRIPAWGPLGMTSGGLPWIAPVGYVMYNVIPVAIIVWAARRISGRFRTNRLRTLLAAGVLFGFLWDMGFEMVGARMGWWRYARGYGGLTVFAGTPYLYTVTLSLLMTTVFTVAAYFVGRVDENGLTLLQRWAVARSATRPGPWLILAAMVVAHVTYVVVFLPNMLAKLANVAGPEARLPLFNGLAPQPGSAPSDYATVGGLILAVVLIAILAGFLYAVIRKDPQARTAPTYPASIRAGLA